MKSLFYCIYSTCVPVVGIELEVISDRMAQGDNIYVLRCHGELEYCDLNPNHDESICERCNKMFYQNIRFVNLPWKNVLNIPTVSVDYSVLPSEFTSIDDLKNFSINGLTIGYGVASTFISEIWDHNPDTIRYKEKINKILRTSWYTHNFIQAVLDQIRPDTVFFQGGRVANINPIYKLCQSRGITTISYDNAGILGRYSLRENYIFFEVDKYSQRVSDLWNKCSDDNKEEIASKWFLDRGNRLDVEWTCLVKDQDLGLLPEGFDANKKNIGIFNSSMNEYIALEYFQNNIYKDEFEALYKIFDTFRDDSAIHFYLRVHPHLTGKENSQTQQLKVLRRANYPNVTIVGPEEKIDSYALVDACDQIIVFSSTIGPEACFLGKPVILLGTALYQNTGCCYTPKDHDEVIELIGSDLKPKPKEAALMYGYWKMRGGISFKRYNAISFQTGTYMGKSLELKPPGIMVRGLNRIARTSKRVLRLLLRPRETACKIRKRFL